MKRFFLQSLLLPLLNVGSKDDIWIDDYQHPIDLGFIGLVSLNEKGMLNSEVQKTETTKTTRYNPLENHPRYRRDSVLHPRADDGGSLCGRTQAGT